MADSQADEIVADAEIEGVPSRSAFGGFFRGVLLGCLLVAAALIFWSTMAPDPTGPAKSDTQLGASGGNRAVVAQTPTPEVDAEVAKAPLADGSEVSQPEPTAPSDAPTTQPSSGSVQGVTAEAEPEAPEQEDSLAVSDQPSGAAGGQQNDQVIDLQAPPDSSETDELLAQSPAALALPGPALEVNAIAFDAPADAPLIAIVLSDAHLGNIDPDELMLMTMPLTVAVRPDREGAATLADSARYSGHEVLAQLPFDMSTDTETPLDPVAQRVLILDALASLPMAIGVTAPEGAPALNDRRVMNGLVTELARHGHAYLAMRAGIGSIARRMARNRNIPYVESNRYADGTATEDQIYQMIDGAAFQARRSGTAVIALEASEDALNAIVKWGLERGGQQVWFAPLSAVIARGRLE